MAIEVIQTGLPGVLLINPHVFEDDRGFFFESFNKRDWIDATGIDRDFVQDNHSLSCKGVLRGLHYQLPPFVQGKLIRVLVGEIFDVAVDLRRGSPTFGRWFGQMLSSKNKLQMWIPEGFAHGFLVLSDIAEIHYKATDYYHPNSERGLRWDDPDLAVCWPLDEKDTFKSFLPLLSDKDNDLPLLMQQEKESLPVFG